MYTNQLRLFLGIVLCVHIGASLLIYSNTLQNSFQDRSWATHSLTSPSPLYTGSTYSISFTCNNYGVLCLYDATALIASNYVSISFAVHGGTIPSVNLNVLLMDANLNSLGTSQTVATTSGAWKVITIAISAFKLTTTTFYAVGIQYAGSNNAGVIYFDQILLTTPSPSTVAPSPAPSAAPNAYSLISGAQPDWHDTFSGTSLNTTKWPQNQNYVYNGDVQFSSRNVVVNNGLTIYAHNNGGSGTCGWSGASIDGWTYPGTSENEFLYGLFQFKGVQFQGVSGINPVILLWDQTNTWQAEIDLLESWNGVAWDVTFHSGGNTGNDVQTSTAVTQNLDVAFELDFIWTSTGYYVYSNGALVVKYTGGGSGPIIYQKPMFISLWCGACTAGGTPPASADGSFLKIASVYHYPLSQLASYPGK